METLMLVLRVTLSLACVVGLIWYAGRKLGAGAPRAGRASDEHDVRVVGRQAVSRHSGVAVVAIGTRRILVGYGEQQVQMLTELGPVVPTPEPAPPPTPVRSRAGDSNGLPAAVGAAVKPQLTGKLAGSVLAPDTWRTFVRTLQERTVRR